MIPTITDSLRKLMKNSRYRCKHVMDMRVTSLEWRWEVFGRDGGVHVWIRERDFDGARTFYGGVEVHRCVPNDDTPPHHLDCPITGGRCWHDGSSLAMEENCEHFKPNYLEHDRMFGIAIDWYQSHVSRSMAVTDEEGQ